MGRGTSVGARGSGSCLLSVGLHHPTQVGRFVGYMFLVNRDFIFLILKSLVSEGTTYQI